MKINLNEDTLARWAVCAALGELGDEKWKEYEKSITPENAKMQDVVFTVNGVELDFSLVIKRIGEKFDDAVKVAAAEMYTEKFGDASEQLTKDLSAISEILHDTVRKKFPEIEWGYYFDR